MELKDKLKENSEKLKENIKERNITCYSVLDTVKNSLDGIKFYALEGKSIIIYIVGLIIEIILGFVYRINGLEWILIICIFGVMLSVELLNTAIEAVCDCITKEYNILIKKAKDCGSAATFIIFLVAIILNIIIFLPKIVALF